MTTNRDKIASPADVLAFWRDAGPEQMVHAGDEAFDAEIRRQVPCDL